MSIPIIASNISNALTIKMVQATTNKDDHLPRLKYCISVNGYIPDSADDFQRIVLPTSLQSDVIALLNEGHQVAINMKI